MMMVTRINKHSANLREKENAKPPEEIFVQLFGLKSVSREIAAYDSDPREVHDNGRPVYRYRLQSSPSYTLKEVSELAQVYTNEIVVPTVTDRRILQLQLGRFLTWLAKREREGLE